MTCLQGYRLKVFLLIGAKIINNFPRITFTHAFRRTGERSSSSLCCSKTTCDGRKATVGLTCRHTCNTSFFFVFARMDLRTSSLEQSLPPVLLTVVCVHCVSWHVCDVYGPRAHGERASRRWRKRQSQRYGGRGGAVRRTGGREGGSACSH